MAEALLRELGGEKFEAFSAGVEPATDVHPLALSQLRSTIDNLDKLKAKSWMQFTSANAPPMDTIIALCDEACEKNAPKFPGQPVFCQWNFPDPLAESDSEEKQKQVFEKVFRQLLRRISVFVALPITAMKPSEQQIRVNEMDGSECVAAPRA
jgi:protein-tyrosine-phosphatase